MANNFVTDNFGMDDLTKDISVGKTNDQAILRRLILALVLGDEFQALTVVRNPSPAPAKLHLEALEITLVLLYLDKWLGIFGRRY